MVIAEVNMIKKKKSIEEMEKELGIDKIQGTYCLTPSEQEDTERDGDYFNDLYEEQIRKLYELEYPDNAK